jgi:hypothetical protein
MEPAFGIDAMKAAAHRLEPSPEGGKRLGFEIDVAEFDLPGPHRAKEPVALPVDAGVTDGASDVVPDGQSRWHVRPVLRPPPAGAVPQSITIHRLADEGLAVIVISDLPKNLSNRQRRS